MINITTCQAVRQVINSTRELIENHKGKLLIAHSIISLSGIVLSSFISDQSSRFHLITFSALNLAFDGMAAIVIYSRNPQHGDDVAVGYLAV